MTATRDLANPPAAQGNRGTSITTRPMVPEDLPEVLELLRTCLGEERKQWTEGFWRWKHEQNPFGKSTCLLACSGQRIVGLRAFLRWEFTNARGQLVRAVRAVDTATHPEFQGCGIFTRLTRELLDQLGAEGIELVFNTPNAKSRPGYLKMGWRLVGRAPLWACPTGRVRVGAATSGSLPSGAECLLDASLTEPASVPPRRGLKTRFSGAYLRWRYLENPAFKYGAWASAGAFLVYRVRARAGLIEGMLVEAHCQPGLRPILELSGLLRAAKGLGCHYLLAAAPRVSGRAPALALAGFAPLPRVGPHLTLREVPPNLLEGLPPLDVSVGDLEMF